MVNRKPPQPIETVPKNGQPVIVYEPNGESNPYRYKLYKPDGVRQMGVPGRWQKMNEYGGWLNSLEPKGEWELWLPGIKYGAKP